MNIKEATAIITKGRNLSIDEMSGVMRDIMSGNTTPAQIGSLLTALCMKGETVDELTSAALVMREFASKVNVKNSHVLDIVGTGGDGMSLFNVSTAAALVACAAGATVAKHGNRAATGKSGSADVLEEAGVNIILSPDQVAETIDDIGIGFLFAPQHHSATKHVVGPRKEIGIRTIFNLLGPLTNPANARWQLVGVFSKTWVRPLAEVLKKLGSVHTLVVCSDDGSDEISIAAGTTVAELKDENIIEYEITPEMFNIERQSLETLVVKNPNDSYRMIGQALSGQLGPAADLIAFNAGAGIYAADIVTSLEDGIKTAYDVLAEGSALAKMQELIKYTNKFKP